MQIFTILLAVAVFEAFADALPMQREFVLLAVHELSLLKHIPLESVTKRFIEPCDILGEMQCSDRLVQKCQDNGKGFIWVAVRTCLPL